MLAWTIGSFVIAGDDKTTKRLVGLLSSGLALDERAPHDDLPTWNLTHVATGFRVVMLRGAFGEIIGTADEIASCADWGFATLPPPSEAREALIAVMRLYPHIIVAPSGKAGKAEDAQRVQAEAAS